MSKPGSDISLGELQDFIYLNSRDRKKQFLKVAERTTGTKYITEDEKGLYKVSLIIKKGLKLPPSLVEKAKNILKDAPIKFNLDDATINAARTDKKSEYSDEEIIKLYKDYAESSKSQKSSKKKQSEELPEEPPEEPPQPPEEASQSPEEPPQPAQAPEEISQPPEEPPKELTPRRKITVAELTRQINEINELRQQLVDMRKRLLDNQDPDPTIITALKNDYTKIAGNIGRKLYKHVDDLRKYKKTKKEIIEAEEISEIEKDITKFSERIRKIEEDEDNFLDKDYYNKILKQPEEEEFLKVETTKDQKDLSKIAEKSRIDAETDAYLAEDESNYPTDYLKVEDDMNQALMSKPYTYEQVVKFKEYFKDKSIDEIKNFVAKVKYFDNPISFTYGTSLSVMPDIPNPLEGILDAPAVSINQLAGMMADTAAPVPETEPVETMVDRIPEDLSFQEGGSVTLPYIKRYHPIPLGWYFNSSSAPKWNQVLEQNVLKTEISKEEVINVMDDIIEEYSKKIFVKKRKSDTKVELNELLQLMFKFEGIHPSIFGDTVNMKLSDINKIQNAAAQAAGQTTQPINQAIPQAITNPTVTTQTASDSNFIENYDKWQRYDGVDIGKLYLRKYSDADIYTTRSMEDSHTIHTINKNKV